MKAKKDSADKETIAKARMNFGIVHGICNIINYITMGANLFFLYQVTAVQKNCVYCDKICGYYQRTCVLFTYSDSFLEQEFQNKTLILTKDHIQTFNEKHKNIGRQKISQHSSSFNLIECKLKVEQNCKGKAFKIGQIVKS